ncbi:hypothetical protein GCM10011505_06620 [Tistrella bauzanensis]|uniref:2Fe-2S ferredoxin-type domain-containing protein n=1 Tax=Tistrella bauzanensis TaxID=657419 RepID=A0ABQ1IAU4_9PROT|nr:(2Fe-2S)-binding protein [Tistrella bauzanensis]GGB28039.1 hypothetical protein GCM10011505_06620 [Tistrella bauzanensis]
MDARTPATHAPRTISMTLAVNGKDWQLTVDPRTSLLDALRDHLGLTGAKKGCDHGQCGACTLLVDGRRVLGCLTLVARMNGRSVTSIEGLADDDAPLHPMQQAFIDHDAFQCGYCTPGQILSAIACVEEGHADRGDDAIRDHMSGNLCRCAAYPNIVAAVRAGGAAMRAAGAGRDIAADDTVDGAAPQPVEVDDAAVPA